MTLMKQTFRSWELVLIAAIFIVLFDNGAFWSSLFNLSDSIEAVNILFIASVFIAVVAATVILLSLTAFKYLFKLLLILTLLAAALADYYMSEYGILIDKNMVRNMFLTDRAEVLELFLSSDMLFHLFIFGVVPSVLVVKLKLVDESLINNVIPRLMMIFASLVVVGVVGFLQYKNFVIVYRQNRDMICQINPICPFVSVTKYVYRLNKPRQELHQIAMDAVQVNPVEARKRNVVVLVVGETARAANFSLNEYDRETNPDLKKEDVVNFTNVYSCGTSTAESLPCMFSHLSHAEADKVDPLVYENLLDVLLRAGIKVHWRDNDAGCKGVCNRITIEDLYGADEPKFCNDGNCYDEILLEGLDDLLKRDSSDLLLILHPKGSHGPAYYRRYPETHRRFTPECTNVDVQDCSREEIVNSYDNTILYTDYILSEVIRTLDKHAGEFNAAMLYISDHGESLGEKGIYLHGLPYFIAPDEQIHVPMVFWLSQGYREYMNIDQQCLRDHSHSRFSHENLFDTILGMFHIQTALYKREEDILALCKAS